MTLWNIVWDIQQRLTGVIERRVERQFFSLIETNPLAHEAEVAADRQRRRCQHRRGLAFEQVGAQHLGNRERRSGEGQRIAQAVVGQPGDFFFRAAGQNMPDIDAHFGCIPFERLHAQQQRIVF